MNAAKYIRYILTIATALLFFSACKDDKNESQPTDFILRVNVGAGGVGLEPLDVLVLADH